MNATEDARTKFQILDGLENNPSFVSACGVDVVQKFPFVRAAIAAKRFGQIAKLTDFVQKPPVSALDDAAATQRAAIISDLDYLSATVEEKSK